MYNMNKIVGTHDILFITLDTLRYDVAQNELEKGNLPNIENIIKSKTWEKRHAPGNFTYASHHAFFSGFLPTPASPGVHPRLFASEFAGSETTKKNTFVFEESNLVEALSAKGYHTICIGGVGFFNKKSPLASVFPDMFDESHWDESFGVTDKDSAKNQIEFAVKRYESALKNKPDSHVFLFINISALHQPNYFYVENEKNDSIKTHAAALRYVDSQLGVLFETMKKRNKLFGIICSDHGTTYGEDGYTGHRLAHEAVWNIPYADFLYS